MGRLRHDGTAEEWARGEPFNQPVANHTVATHTVATHTVANHTCVRCAHPGDKDFLDDLPFKLRAELSMSMHQEMVSRVPFFQDAEEKFISDLVVRLTPQIHMPGDTIIIEGEPGDRMFFVSSGQVGCCTRLQVPPQQLQSSWPGRLLIASTGGGGSDESNGKRHWAAGGHGGRMGGGGRRVGSSHARSYGVRQHLAWCLAWCLAWWQ